MNNYDQQVRRQKLQQSEGVQKCLFRSIHICIDRNRILDPYMLPGQQSSGNQLPAARFTQPSHARVSAKNHERDVALLDRLLNGIEHVGFTTYF